MADQDNVRERISKAWHHHREGRASDAMKEFQTIVQQFPKDIDANYGLGLAQKNSGDVDGAIKSFKNALELIVQSKQSYEASHEQSQDPDHIKTPEEDRFMMLTRMVKQRLSELQQSARA